MQYQVYLRPCVGSELNRFTVMENNTEYRVDSAGYITEIKYDKNNFVRSKKVLNENKDAAKIARINAAVSRAVELGLSLSNLKLSFIN